MELSNNIIFYLKKHHTAIVSTFDDKGRIHCSIKGIVGIMPEGKVHIIDVYKLNTYKNLLKNPEISVTMFNEKNFTGYTLQGKAKIVPRNDINDHLILEWEERVTKRIATRVIESVQTETESNKHYEAELPKKPQYLIEVDIDNIVDLSPPHMRRK
ncbi:MAG: pyridoxamine 5'-phosphate oxidase family protein [Candidatus Aureabacteria bacterium]|nr:pyridoxamine 5'-phosphate oxidase family protein [Candidatus Auribacterota bacterium]